MISGEVTFNISSKKYWPYRKPGNPPLHVNVNSNHPSTIIKKIPSMINKRLVDTSCDPVEFNKTKGIYYRCVVQNVHTLRILKCAGFVPVFPKFFYVE